MHVAICAKFYQQIDPEYIVQTVCDEVGVSVEDVKTNSGRQARKVLARMFCFKLIKQFLPSMSLYEISRAVNNCHHSTILHAFEIIQNRIEREDMVQDLYQRIHKKIIMNA